VRPNGEGTEQRGRTLTRTEAAVNNRSVDASVGIGGYRMSRADSFIRATDTVLELLVRSSITAARIELSSWEELAVARTLIRRRLDEGHAAPSLFGGGPMLVDREPRNEREYWAADADGVRVAIDTALAHGVGWLVVAFENTDAAVQAIGLAHEAGLRVAYSGVPSAVEALTRGDHFVDLPGLLRKAGDTPLQLMQRWASVDSPDILARLDEQRVTVGSGLLALRRAVFIREALDAPFLEELVPILPHTEHVREMKRPGGYLAAKRKLRENTGLTEPSRMEAAHAEEGWQKLLAAAATAPTIVPASRAPQFTSVPGYAWHEECALLSHAGVPAPETRGALLLTE
jgi:hypothetical protein